MSDLVRRAPAASGAHEAVEGDIEHRSRREAASARLASMSARQHSFGSLLGGRYRLLEPISRGAMGTIWRAEQLELRCLVAIKLLDEEALSGAGALERFLREARATAAVRSPHVVQILDYGWHDRTPYLVLELLEGESLQQRLARVRRLSCRATVQILSQVGSALERAHALGIVHRDLSANNVFLLSGEPRPFAKLLDFGIAKQSSNELGKADASLTLRGMILGTPRYMSPEQVQGGKVDARTDIWAMGVLAFECLVGAPPFSGDTFGSLVLAICAPNKPIPSRVAGAQPGDAQQNGFARAQPGEPYTDLYPPLPRAFDAWFARACATDASERFPSATSAAKALQRALVRSRHASVGK